MGEPTRVVPSGLRRWTRIGVGTIGATGEVAR